MCMEESEKCAVSAADVYKIPHIPLLQLLCCDAVIEAPIAIFVDHCAGMSVEVFLRFLFVIHV